MKKIGLVAIVLLIASSIQAGQVNWSATGIRDPDGLTTITSTDMLYVEIYYAAAALSQNNNVWETTWGSGGTMITGGLIDTTAGNAGVISALSGNLGFGILTDVQATAIQDANGFGSFYMKVYYAPTGVASPANYTYSGVTHYKTFYLDNVESQDVALSYTTVSSGGHIQWTAIPEPTTMMLFGLGGLAMVLRRKMKKEA